MKIEINFNEVSKQLNKLLSEKKELLKDEIDKALLSSVLDMEREAVLNVAVDNGELRNSINYKEKSTGDVIEYHLTTDAPHAKYIEFGTKAHYPPQDVIKAWAERQGIENWFVIWLSIGKKGTKARPFLRPAFYKYEKDTYVRVSKAIAKTLSK